VADIYGLFVPFMTRATPARGRGKPWPRVARSRVFGALSLCTSQVLSTVKSNLLQSLRKLTSLSAK
jgi:hypothetical protein